MQISCNDYHKLTLKSWHMETLLFPEWTDDQRCSKITWFNFSTIVNAPPLSSPGLITRLNCQDFALPILEWPIMLISVLTIIWQGIPLHGGNGSHSESEVYKHSQFASLITPFPASQSSCTDQESDFVQIGSRLRGYSEEHIFKRCKVKYQQIQMLKCTTYLTDQRDFFITFFSELTRTV